MDSKNNYFQIVTDFINHVHHIRKLINKDQLGKDSIEYLNDKKYDVLEVVEKMKNNTNWIYEIPLQQIKFTIEHIYANLQLKYQHILEIINKTKIKYSILKNDIHELETSYLAYKMLYKRINYRKNKKDYYIQQNQENELFYIDFIDSNIESNNVRIDLDIKIDLPEDIRKIYNRKFKIKMKIKNEDIICLRLEIFESILVEFFNNLKNNQIKSRKDIFENLVMYRIEESLILISNQLFLNYKSMDQQRLKEIEKKYLGIQNIIQQNTNNNYEYILLLSLFFEKCPGICFWIKNEKIEWIDQLKKKNSQYWYFLEWII